MQSRGREYLDLDAQSERLRVVCLHANESLVPADDFDNATIQAAQRRHHLGRDRLVRRGVDGQYHGVRRLAGSQPQRYIRAHAERACLVGARRNHRSVARIAAGRPR
jgi:hypothetical protein